MEHSPEQPTSASFPTTCWSRVACAGSATDREAHAALEGLCHDYWYPLYVYVRRQGVGADDACDLVQGFLADLIERRDLVVADPKRGRFRSFLKAACSHYQANQRVYDRALKRGGGRRVIPIDVVDSEGRYGREPWHVLTAEKLYERQWALSLLEKVLVRLEAETVRSGKAELFTHLRPMLEGDDLAESYRKVGESLGMREDAVKVAAHRLRARYRTLLREEVARTVSDPGQVEDELRGLLAALSC
jgi:DNA-directed RNA polymerase specialized sigma24 family protein